jgi:hypothetical protein
MLTSVAAIALIAGPAAAQADDNVALNKLATSPNLPCTLSSGPQKAVDGKDTNIYTDKWCTRSTVSSLTVNLGLGQYGMGYTLDRFVVENAGVAGESPLYNTRDFSISVSANGLTWSKVASVTNNTANTSTIYLPSQLPYITAIRLDITAPTQSGAGAARIYEFQAWGGSTSFVGGSGGGSPHA